MELCDLYSKDRVRLGRTMVRGDAQPQGTFRIIVHSCLFNSKGLMLVQKRQGTKESWSNLWDMTANGSAIAGETSQEAMGRELFEELGIRHDFRHDPPLLTVTENGCFYDIYLFKADCDLDRLVLQAEEVQEVSWADADGIKRMVVDGSFVPYPASFIDLLFHYARNGTNPEGVIFIPEAS